MSVSDSETREMLIRTRNELARVTADRTRIETTLVALRSVLNPRGDLAVEVSELLTYAVQCRNVQARFVEMVAQLRAVPHPEAAAIGNSMDALFRSAPVPDVVARR